MWNETVPQIIIDIEIHEKKNETRDMSEWTVFSFFSFLFFQTRDSVIYDQCQINKALLFHKPRKDSRITTQANQQQLQAEAWAVIGQWKRS